MPLSVCQSSSLFSALKPDSQYFLHMFFPPKKLSLVWSPVKRKKRLFGAAFEQRIPTSTFSPSASCQILPITGKEKLGVALLKYLHALWLQTCSSTAVDF